MSEPIPSLPKVSFLQRYDFLLRRLHSIAGILPIGIFLINHLLTNSSLAWGKFALRGEHEELSIAQGGAYYFQKEVAWINEQIPHLLLIEISLWLAIAFHSIYGIYLIYTGKSNVSSYRYSANWRYWLQRISGYVGILFILYHVATLRWGWTFLVPGNTQWSHKFSASTLGAAIQGSAEGLTTLGVAVALFYMLGVSMLVFHFANGLWTWAITWGLTISQAAQRRWGYACAGLGTAMMLMAWSSVIAAATMNVKNAKAAEELYNAKAESLNVPALQVTPMQTGSNSRP